MTRYAAYSAFYYISVDSYKFFLYGHYTKSINALKCVLCCLNLLKDIRLFLLGISPPLGLLFPPAGSTFPPRWVYFIVLLCLFALVILAVIRSGCFMITFIREIAFYLQCDIA